MMKIWQMWCVSMHSRQLASLTDKDISKLKEDTAKLSHFAVETKYPEFEPPLSEDALEALEISYKIKIKSHKWIKVIEEEG